MRGADGYGVRMGDNESAIPLRQALSELRAELKAAMNDADDELRLEVREVQVELSLERAASVKAEAGASLWRVVTAKGAGELSRTRNHTISLTLEPRSVAADGSRGHVDLTAPKVRDDED